MADKPYTERKAGSFVKDRDTGQLRPHEAAASTPRAKPDKPAAPAAEKKGN